MDSPCWARCFNASVLPRKSESERDEISVSKRLTEATTDAYCCLVDSPLSEVLKIPLRRPPNEACTLVLLLRIRREEVLLLLHPDKPSLIPFPRNGEELRGRLWRMNFRSAIVEWEGVGEIEGRWFSNWELQSGDTMFRRRAGRIAGGGRQESG